METPPLTEAQSDALQAFLDLSIRVILDSEDSQTYFRWVTEQLLSRPASQQDQETIATFHWLARSLWNSTPLPGNHFRPRPLPDPGRNDPCPCGSGKKFKRCCANGDINKDIDPDLIMSMVLDHLSPAQRKQATLHAPVDFQLALAEYELEQHHPGRARDLLLAMLASPPRNDFQHASAIELLARSYHELGHHRAGQRKLHEVAKDNRGLPACAALHILSALELEAGRPQAALPLIERANREAPDQVYGGVLEVMALTELERVDEATQRAAHWRGIAESQGREEAELFRALETAPFEAITEDKTSGNEGNVATDELVAILDAANARPLPKARFDTWPSEAGKVPHALQLPEAVARAEADWYAQHLDDNAHADTDTQWLERHPAALDSLAILEEMLGMLEPIPLEEIDVGPLLQRLEQRRDKLAAHYLGALSDNAVLPWGWLENRPLLRTLYEQALDSEDHDPDLAVEKMQRLLVLTPTDNQGVRFPLINLLLELDRNQEALALAERYPEDPYPETTFGKVLALVRLGRIVKAEQALRDAHRLLPRVIDYLVPASKKPPKLQLDYVTLGGPDQAWWYREAMRPEYERTAGMLEWLKDRKKRIKAGR
ncbi:hypothetical protein GCM10007160_21630 [Litchfieldella qijiaojingensis]|uniref:Tetratricopeptide repeat protein n=2 Tax=Litchfieldella qijiaojingensis TaxID=980347 RepID=A0ABQ2YTR4_9GAMM|nr:hypothetical protein GCM10007160_21630 [Halomonas qijiaojingensis]